MEPEVIVNEQRGALLARNLARRLGAALVETHISWVLLTPALAYKIKKPVRLAFVDYSRLSYRKFFCEEELRLNARLAPSLYLGVSAIHGSPRDPRLDGDGPAIEYAVRMQRFPDGALFAELAQGGRLLPADVDALAALLARFHGAAPEAAPGSGFGEPAARRRVAMAALAGAEPCLNPGESQRLGQWLDAQANALSPLWLERLATGRIRECHGDLHLSNVVRLQEGVAAFDGIEFDPALRWIDVIDDLAFAVMDFAAHGRRDLAFRLLNAWLDVTGDHAALACLRFAAAYRALVRAQAESLRHAREPARRYAEAALRWTGPGMPKLFVTHGLPGSGKTWRSQQLLEAQGAIRLRSDVERKRLFGLGMLENSRAAGLDLYSTQATARTYGKLFDLARAALRSGYPVILDAAFLRRDERARAHALADELGVPFGIIACNAPPQVLRARLLARKSDASEADLAVLERLSALAEPLDARELDWTVPQAGP